MRYLCVVCFTAFSKTAKWSECCASPTLFRCRIWRALSIYLHSMVCENRNWYHWSKWFTQFPSTNYFHPKILCKCFVLYFYLCPLMYIMICRLPKKTAQSMTPLIHTPDNISSEEFSTMRSGQSVVKAWFYYLF